MSLVVVTGGNGFVGRGVVARFAAEPAFRVRVAVRREGAPLPDGVEVSIVGDLGPDTDYGRALTDSDAVVHCAGRVDVMRDKSADPPLEYRSASVDGTANLARDSWVRASGSAWCFSELGTPTVRFASGSSVPPTIRRTCVPARTSRP